MRPSRLRRQVASGGLACLLALSCEHSAPTAPPATGPARIALTSILSLGLHAPYQLTPVVFDSAGLDITKTSPINWTSSDAAVASVTDAGLVTGVALGGPVTLTARSGSVAASITLSVVPADVVISPALRSVALATTQQLSANPIDYFGAPIDAGPIVWASLNPDVATVDASTGLLTGVALGNAIVSATAAGRTASFSFFVGAPSPLDRLYESSPGNDPVEVKVFLGRITNFAGTFHVQGCARAVTASPDALIAPRVIVFGADTTVGGLSASFASPDGGTSIEVQFSEPDLMSGFFSGSLLRVDHPCVIGATNITAAFWVHR